MCGTLAIRYGLALSLALALAFVSGCGSSASPGGSGVGATGTGGAPAVTPTPGTGGSTVGATDAATAPAASDGAALATDASGSGVADLAEPASGDGSGPPPSVDANATDGGVIADGSPPRDGDVQTPPDTGAAETAGGIMDARGPMDGGTPDTTLPPPSDANSPASAYACTLMIGIQATEEWYNFGFETMVDNSKWELIWVHSGFVELWANPSDPVWSTAVTSPCALNPGKPDRVIFLALNFLYTTAAEWNPVVTMAVDNIKTKYPSAKRIELMSFIRAPGNNACSQAPAPRSTITPAQDDAMAISAAANPGLVFVAPKFEAKTCAEFSSNPPHPSPAGVTAWVKLMADYYR